MGQFLLIAHPPHPAADANVAAAVLGLHPVDANLKARYSVPEIWVADSDRLTVERAGARLKAAGMRFVIATGQDIANVPSQLLVRSFTFEEHKVVLKLPTATISIAYDREAVIVPCSPRPADGMAPLPRTVGGVQVSDASSFVDLYVRSRHEWLRLAVYAELVDFMGLGERVSPSQPRNMTFLCQQLHRRFTNAQYDDRLVNMQLRRRPGYGTPPQFMEARKGYSYASPSLTKLLDLIAPSLREISQPEFSSRLVFLTTRVSESRVQEQSPHEPSASQ